MVRYGNEPLHLWAAFPGMSRADAIAKEILWVDWPGTDVTAAPPRRARAASSDPSAAGPRPRSGQ
jgi:hypothetical protein